jgi:hypothetical protein
MHVSRVFTARDIAVLADARRAEAWKLIRKLRDAGEIYACVTGRISPRKGRETVWQVRNRNEFFLKHVASAEGGAPHARSQ